jgi:hypothetical protein
MALNRIKSDAEKADQMIAELARQSTGEENPGESPMEAPTTEALAQDADVQATNDPGAVSGQESVDHGTQDHSESRESATTDDAERIREEARKWEQRYKSLNGMIESRDRQIQQLHDLIAGMQQHSQQAQSEETGSEQETYITDEDNKLFGSDMVDMARRAAREESRAMVAELRKELNAFKQELQGVSKTAQKSVQETFQTKLANTVPNWRDIDTDPEFIEWLRSTPARMQVFSQCVQQQDVQGTAYFYDEFSKLKNKKTAEAEAPKQQKRQQLESQVSPGKSKGAAPNAQSGEKKIWTRSEISQAYSNRKQVDASEFARIEREIAQAQREGRVDYSK